MTNREPRTEIVVTGVPPSEVEAALGFIGASGFQIEVREVYDESLGWATEEDFIKTGQDLFGQRSSAGVVAWNRLHRTHGDLITQKRAEAARMDIDRLADLLPRIGYIAGFGAKSQEVVRHLIIERQRPERGQD